MITIQNETWEQYYNDPQRAKLWLEHYLEFKPIHEERLSFDPDVAVYRALDSAGALEVVIARDDGKMIGYCLAVVRRHMHYAERCAFEDSYFLTKASRGGVTFARMVEKMNAVCAMRGAKKIYWMTKKFRNVGALFERLGMEHQDEVWTLWLQKETP